MTGNHIGLELVADDFGKDHRVEEDSGLGHFGLLEVFLGAVEHQVRDAEAEYFVCFLKHLLSLGALFVEVLAHAYELRSLAGKHECFHNCGI